MDFKPLLDNWSIRFKKLRNDILIPGSPERCLFRIVVEDQKGNLFLLENIDDCKIDLKLTIIRYLDALLEKGLQGIVTYLKSDSGTYIVSYEKRHWQLVPYIEGVALKRPGYVYDQWRGEHMASFLIELMKKSKHLQVASDADVFSIVDYIYHLMDTIRVHAPQVFTKLKPVLAFLEDQFVTAHDRMPVKFCHGDYHPLNIIWGRDKIRAVIDWEFTGFKAEIYDVANLIGCIGVEDPLSLKGELVMAFIKKMKTMTPLSELSWEYLPEFIIALRFAWMSEWLRKNDTEMIKLEEIYMLLLMENRDLLREMWQI